MRSGANFLWPSWWIESLLWQQYSLVFFRWGGGRLSRASEDNGKCSIFSWHSQPHIPNLSLYFLLHPEFLPPATTNFSPFLYFLTRLGAGRWDFLTFGVSKSSWLLFSLRLSLSHLSLLFWFSLSLSSFPLFPICVCECVSGKSRNTGNSGKLRSSFLRQLLLFWLERKFAGSDGKQTGSWWACFPSCLAF